MSSEARFQFFPRPEAKASKWQHLIPPVKTAVHDLLAMLDGAVRQSEIEGLEVASCFLVNGERGTGKTSVLMNAKEAVNNGEKAFFAEGDEKNDSKFVLMREEASQCAKSIQGKAVWLDMLDLELLQAETNLLTTVLTRIRDALNNMGEQGNREEVTSIYEADPDSARPMFDKLIGDATVMWETIKEPDTRNTANRQISAAAIHAKFRESFRQAMDKLVKKLGMPCGRNSRRAIILPIDNIDRSTEHLQNIVKLAQLVSHPCLWLVMAGGREDITTFLERAYWKELIRNSDLPAAHGALGRNEPNGEDESLSMARRQAAATAQKIWPSSHRIFVGPMQPEETLAFYPVDRQEYGSIECLLKQVSIPTLIKKNNEPVKLPFFSLFQHAVEPFDFSEYKNDEAKNKWLINQFKSHNTKGKNTKLDEKIRYLNSIVDTVDLEKSSKNDIDKAIKQIFIAMNGLVKEEMILENLDKSDNTDLPVDQIYRNINFLKEYYSIEIPRQLTQAAKDGLKMPARSVLELWQLAYWVTHDKTFATHADGREAEQIARTMLRNAISESRLSNHLSRSLQENVIRNDANGGTLIEFIRQNLTVQCIAQNDTEREKKIYEVEDEIEKKTVNIQSCVLVKRGNESFLRFSIRQGADDQENAEELPDLVAAWLTILYDILVFAERVAVVIKEPPKPVPKMITRHIVVLQMGNHWQTVRIDRNWPTPEWSTFWAYGLFWHRWGRFQHKLESAFESACTRNTEWKAYADKVPSVLAMGWVSCVLWVYYAMRQIVNPSDCDAQNIEIKEIVEGIVGDLRQYDELPLADKEFIQQFEQLITKLASVYHHCLKDTVKKPFRLRQSLDSQAMLDWLVNEMPMFFSFWYDHTKNPNQSKQDFYQKLSKMRGDADGASHIKNGSSEASNNILSSMTRDLAKVWECNIPFMVAAMDQSIAGQIIPKEGTTADAKRDWLNDKEQCLAIMKKLRCLSCYPGNHLISQG